MKVLLTLIIIIFLFNYRVLAQANSTIKVTKGNKIGVEKEMTDSLVKSCIKLSQFYPENYFDKCEIVSYVVSSVCPHQDWISFNCSTDSFSLKIVNRFNSLYSSCQVIFHDIKCLNGNEIIELNIKITKRPFPRLSLAKRNLSVN